MRPLTCEHVANGSCHRCFTDWHNAVTADRARTAATRNRQRITVVRPERDIPHDRNFPDSDAWIDDDGVVHQDD